MRVLIEEVLAPLTGRLGSIVAGVLVGVGASEPHAELVGVGVGALLLIGAELTIRYVKNRKG